MVSKLCSKYSGREGCGFFQEAISNFVVYHRMVEILMIDEMESIWKKAVMT
jgi:hypothetical protein